MQVPSRRLDRRWRWVRTRAAVAVVLREGRSGPEVLLMERAQRSGDPWSGDVSFPGGHAEPHDEDDRATAARETQEELGLDLSGAPVVGRLSAVLAVTTRGGVRPFVVTPIVFQWVGDAAFDLSSEARSAFWVPLASLADPAHATRRPWPVLGLPLSFPAWTWEGRVIWGLTRGMLLDLLRRIEPREVSR